VTVTAEEEQKKKKRNKEEEKEEEKISTLLLRDHRTHGSAFCLNAVLIKSSCE
jgi:hypothetical protein